MEREKKPPAPFPREGEQRSLSTHAQWTPVLTRLCWRPGRRPALIGPEQARTAQDKGMVKGRGNEHKRHDDQTDGNR